MRLPLIVNWGKAIQLELAAMLKIDVEDLCPVDMIVMPSWMLLVLVLKSTARG